MKTLLLLIAFFATSTLSTAQSAMNTSNTNDITVSNISTTVKNDAPSRRAPRRTLRMIQAHNQSAAEQLSTHLNKQLEYSPIMQNNCMEGNLVIEVNLSETGTIVDAKIVESLNPEVDKVVIEALLNPIAIHFKNNVYHGNKRIRIPIDFTMR